MCLLPCFLLSLIFLLGQQQQRAFASPDTPSPTTLPPTPCEPITPSTATVTVSEELASMQQLQLEAAGARSVTFRQQEAGGSYDSLVVVEIADSSNFDLSTMPVSPDGLLKIIAAEKQPSTTAPTPLLSRGAKASLPCSSGWSLALTTSACAAVTAALPTSSSNSLAASAAVATAALLGTQCVASPVLPPCSPELDITFYLHPCLYNGIIFNNWLLTFQGSAEQICSA